MSRARSLALTLFAFAILAPAPASAITRGEVISRAKAFAYHPWKCAAQNLTASCAPSYKSAYVPGDYVGLPYDWGGYMGLFEFDQAMTNGAGAGSYPADGVLACTSGLDCSGFVSMAWATGHYTTSSIPQISSAITAPEMIAGDVFNDAGYHVALFSHSLANGDPVLYEAYGYNVHLNNDGGWSHVDGYTPRRFQGIVGASVIEPLGTPVNPIVINGFPYTDSRDTTQSQSDLLDGCGASPGKSESGPEFVYQVTFTEPGTRTATVADDVNTDIDIHLYTSTNTNDCVARNDSKITVDVDCGTYLLVADTYKGAKEYPGPYTLTATFQPKGAACGNGPPKYSPSGGPGAACGFPGNPDLPFCNPNLGADTCLYTAQSSFCSLPCKADADCGALAGGCCGDIGTGELYCLEASMCNGMGSPPGGQMGAPDAGGDPPAATGAGVGGGAATGATGSGGAGGGDGATSGAGGSGSGGGKSAPGGDRESPGEKSGCSAGGRSPAGAGGMMLAAAIALLAARRRRG
jgi:hypothetical protein